MQSEVRRVPDEKTRAHGEEEHARTRTVRDPQGQIWLVREFVQDLDDCEDRSLLFDNSMAVRRVREYPAAWHLMTEDELAELSRRR